MWTECTDRLGTLAGKRIGVSGLSFKEDTDDVRESPAIAIVRELVRQGAMVCAHDPAAMTKAREVLPSGQILRMRMTSMTRPAAAMRC